MIDTQSTPESADSFPFVERATTVTTIDQARDLAIEWQAWAGEQSLSYGDFADAQTVLAVLGRRFDLTEEFQENGLI